MGWFWRWGVRIMLNIRCHLCLILQVCSSTSVLQAVQNFLGFASTMLVRDSLKSRYQNLRRLSAVWVNFQVLEVNLFCVLNPIVILLSRCYNFVTESFILWCIFFWRWMYRPFTRFGVKFCESCGWIMWLDEEVGVLDIYRMLLAGESSSVRPQ